MWETLQTFLSESHPLFYPTYFIALFLAGVCMPISADLVLLTAGYVLYRGSARFELLLLLALLPILASDTVMFWVGKKFGRKLLSRWPMNRVIQEEGIQRAEAAFQKSGYRVVFFARFMPGIRTVFMATAGVLGLNYGKFIVHDLVGGLIVVPLTLLSVGWVAGNTEAIRARLAQGQWFVLTIALLAFFLYWRRKKKTAK